MTLHQFFAEITVRDVYAIINLIMIFSALNAFIFLLIQFIGVALYELLTGLFSACFSLLQARTIRVRRDYHNTTDDTTDKPTIEPK